MEKQDTVFKVAIGIMTTIVIVLAAGAVMSFI